MIFFGASGHAKVAIEAWIAAGGKVTGVLDDNPLIKEILDYPVSSDYDRAQLKDKEMFVAIGSNDVRRKIALSFPARYRSVVHPDAVISRSSRIGDGTVVMAGVVVNAASTIGEHVILNTCSSIDHDCWIEDFAHISPNATICGGVYIGEGTHVGAGATIIQNVRIGKWAVIGAGSVVLKDIPDFAVVIGIPGKIVRIKEA